MRTGGDRSAASHRPRTVRSARGIEQHGQFLEVERAAVLGRRLPERVPARGRPRGQRDRHGDLDRRRHDRRAPVAAPPRRRAGPGPGRGRGDHGRLLRLDGLPADQDAQRPRGDRRRHRHPARRRRTSRWSAGTHEAKEVYPGGRRPRGRRRRPPATRPSRRCAGCSAGGGTAIGTWLRLADRLLASADVAIRHGILLTDGRNEHETPEELRAALDACAAASPATRAASAPTGRSRSSPASPPRCSAPPTSSPTRPAWPPTSGR